MFYNFLFVRLLRRCVSVLVSLFFSCSLPRTTHFAKWMVWLCLYVWYHRDLVQLGSLLFFLSIFLCFVFISCCCCWCCCCSWVYNGWRYSSESTRLTDTKSMDLLMKSSLVVIVAAVAARSIDYVFVFSTLRTYNTILIINSNESVICAFNTP